MQPKTAATDLTGTWRGHYEQAGSRHGISMRVVQRGQSVVGKMRDDDTLLMSTLQACSAPDGEQGAGVVLGEAEMVTSLPEDSIVEGDVEGAVVEFAKRYQGAQRTTIWLAGRALHVEVPSHCVVYRGELDRLGQALRGEWSIGADESDRVERGRFELHRQ